jgi:hypothetical protein
MLYVGARLVPGRLLLACMLIKCITARPSRRCHAQSSATSVPLLLFYRVFARGVLRELAWPLLTQLFEPATGLGARLDIVLQRCRAAAHGRRDHKGAAMRSAPAVQT